jgi:hypothetical protein
MSTRAIGVPSPPAGQRGHGIVRRVEQARTHEAAISRLPEP